jgi:hypothetical protein
MTHPPTQPVQGGYAESIERELAEVKPKCKTSSRFRE